MLLSKIYTLHITHCIFFHCKALWIKVFAIGGLFLLTLIDLNASDFNQENNKEYILQKFESFKKNLPDQYKLDKSEIEALSKQNMCLRFATYVSKQAWNKLQLGQNNKATKYSRCVLDIFDGKIWKIKRNASPEETGQAASTLFYSFGILDKTLKNYDYTATSQNADFISCIKEQYKNLTQDPIKYYKSSIKTSTNNVIQDGVRDAFKNLMCAGKRSTLIDRKNCNQIHPVYSSINNFLTAQYGHTDGYFWVNTLSEEEAPGNKNYGIYAIKPSFDDQHYIAKIEDDKTSYLRNLNTIKNLYSPIYRDNIQIAPEEYGRESEPSLTVDKKK